MLTNNYYANIVNLCSISSLQSYNCTLLSYFRHLWTVMKEIRVTWTKETWRWLW